MERAIVKIGDILELKNGKKVTVGKNTFWILQEYYDDELNCMTNDGDSVLRIYRPVYTVISEREPNLSK